MKKLYKLNWVCGNMGCLEGLFIADESDLDKLIGEEIYFGEVLGKHSNICGFLEESDVTEKSDDQDLIAKLEEIFPEKTLSGYNPFDYYGDV